MKTVSIAHRFLLNNFKEKYENTSYLALAANIRCREHLFWIFLAWIISFLSFLASSLAQNWILDVNYFKNQTIATLYHVLSQTVLVSSSISLGLSVLWIVKFYAFHTFCGYDRKDHREALEELEEAINNFKLCFFWRPEWLGPDGVAKRLTRIATKKLAIEKMATRVTPQSRGLAMTFKEALQFKEPERRLKARFEYAYASAKNLMDVHDPEEIFEAAAQGLKRPKRLLLIDY